MFTFVSALSNASYVTTDWAVLEENILKNGIFKNDRIELPWMKFSLELLSLGTFHEQLTRRLFSDEFLDKFFDREKNTIDYFLLLMFYQGVKLLRPDYSGPFPAQKYLEHARKLNVITDLPLAPSLNYIFGGRQLFSRVWTSHGHFIDHVIGFDRDGNVLDLNELEVEDVLLDELLHPDRQFVAIIAPPKNHYVHNYPGKLKGIFDIRLRSLETIVPTVVVSQKGFAELPDFEKLPYLQQKIREKLQSR